MLKEVTSEAPCPRALGVAIIGAGTIARAHAEALRVLPSVVWPARVLPQLTTVCSRRAENAKDAAARWGFERWTTDWHEVIEDPAVDLVVNTTPNDLHAEPSIAALRARRSVLCEKPLGRSAEESRQMWEAARAAHAVNATGFNYRFVPAIQLAWDLIQSRRLGDIYHFRSTYLKGSGPNENAPFKWRHDAEIAGLGTLGDLGSHVIDLARWLVGDVGTVQGTTRTFVPERSYTLGLKAVTVDDAAAAVLEFNGGAVGTIEATRFAPPHRNALSFEVNGSLGSIRFNLERLNELEVYLEDGMPEMAGFRQVLVTESDHPYMRYWWASGHIIGWEHSFVHQMEHVLLAAAGSGDIGPVGATFEDGYKAALIADAIAESSLSGRRISVALQ